MEPLPPIPEDRSTLGGGSSLDVMAKSSSVSDASAVLANASSQEAPLGTARESPASDKDDTKLPLITVCSTRRIGFFALALIALVTAIVLTVVFTTGEPHPTEEDEVTPESFAPTTAPTTMTPTMAPTTFAQGRTIFPDQLARINAALALLYNLGGANEPFVPPQPLAPPPPPGLMPPTTETTKPPRPITSGMMDTTETTKPPRPITTTRPTDNLLPFQRPGTPQAQAYQWLLEEDLLVIDALEEGTQSLQERYILTVLFYANGGDSTWAPTSSCDFRSRAVHHCKWCGISCRLNTINTETPQMLSPAVQSIQLAQKGLEGTLPAEELKAMSMLQHVDFSGNNLQGNIPILPHAIYLDLSHNALVGSIPVEYWNTDQLRFLYLHNNQLSGRMQREPEEVLLGAPPSEEDTTPLAFIQDIWIDNNQLTGPLPTWLKELESLERLIVSHNGFTGSLPRLSPNGNLTYIDLSFISTTDVFPESYLQIEALRELYLDSSGLFGTLPDLTQPALSLQKLHLSQNSLTGIIPTSFAVNLPAMQEFVVIGNDLSGNATEDFCNTVGLSSLTRFELDCETVNCACCTNECSDLVTP